MIGTAELVSHSLVCILYNHSHKIRFKYKIPKFGTIMFKLLIHLAEHVCFAALNCAIVKLSSAGFNLTLW